MARAFVSVITPVYNDDPYLEECVRSVLAQTHQDFEYIICDNHSTDRSGEIARDLAATDSRIRVVSPPEFLPQSPNFNFAVRQASGRGQYYKMLSSDDWMFPECLERMAGLAEANPSVGLVSSYRLVEAAPDCFGVPVERSVFPGREAARWQILGTAFPFGTVSTVLYRGDCVREALPTFFPEGRFYFDLDVAFRILGKFDFGFVHQVLTFSRYQPGAIMDEANQLHTWPLMHYVTAEEHGRQFLDPDEFAQHQASVSAELYRTLGEVWLKDRVRRQKRQDIWDFQRKNLAAIGREIRRGDLVKGAVRAGIRFLGCPRDLMASLRRA
jgi:glycosyltransferase involved in cell wall biosynthesis